MKTQIFADVSSQGTITDFKKKEIGKAIKENAGKRIIFTIERKYNKRSTNQNSFFHGVILPILSQALIEAGYNEANSMEWTKDFVKYHCLIKEYVNKKTGEVTKSIGNTSGLTTTEFMELIATIQQWAMENLNCYLPDPNEQIKITY